jgi:hypothetical protein
MTFLTAVRCPVDAAVAYHGSDTEKYLGEVDNLSAPRLMHLGEQDEFTSKTAQAQIKKALGSNPYVRQSTAIRVGITPSLAIMGRTTMPRRRRSPTGGQPNFYIATAINHEQKCNWKSRCEERVLKQRGGH